MATTAVLSVKQSHRLSLVEEHVRLENAHDLDGVIQTFGDAARYDDEPWNLHYEGRDQVRPLGEYVLWHGAQDILFEPL